MTTHGLMTTNPVLMSISWGMADVRDVARAHVLAMEVESAEGRHVCAAETIALGEVVALLRDHGYDHKLPRINLATPMGDAVMKLASYFQPGGVGSFLRTHLGRVPRFDNGKIRNSLGLEFRGVRESILETMKDLERWGHVPSL